MFTSIIATLAMLFMDYNVVTCISNIHTLWKYRERGRA